MMVLGWKGSKMFEGFRIVVSWSVGGHMWSLSRPSCSLPGLSACGRHWHIAERGAIHRLGSPNSSNFQGLHCFTCAKANMLGYSRYSPTFQSFREIYQLKQKYCQIVSVRVFLSINWSRSIHPERLVSQNWSVLLVQFFMASQQCDNVRGLVPKLAALRKMQAPRWVELGLREGLWSWDLHKHTLHENRRHQSLGSGFHWSSWAVSISYQGWDKSPIFAEDMSSGSVWISMDPAHFQWHQCRISVAPVARPLRATPRPCLSSSVARPKSQWSWCACGII